MLAVNWRSVQLASVFTKPSPQSGNLSATAMSFYLFVRSLVGLYVV